MTIVSQPAWATKALDQQKAAELALGLHQAAQPLTVLQGCLELALTGPHTVDDYQRSIRQALNEAQRVSSCFDRVRELVQMSRLVSDAEDFSTPAKGQRARAVSNTKKERYVHV